MFRLLVLAACMALAAGQCAQVTCRCQSGKAMYPSYPMILSCKIPNSDDWVASFIEDDCTWNPTHEFVAGEADDKPSAGPGQWYISKTEGATTPDGDCQNHKACKGLESTALDATSGWWKCELFSPKCWFDAGRVENTVWNGKYGCADNDLPKPAKWGSTCPMTCLPGYKLSGGPTTCRGGKWVNFPRCDQAGCTGMPPKCKGCKGGWTGDCANTQATYPARTTCDPVCNDGWKVGSEATCKMGPGGKPMWVPATCIPPPPPPPPPIAPPTPPPPKGCKQPNWPLNHGNWDCKNAAHGQTCDFKCKPGMMPGGKPPKCINGKWDQQHPSKMSIKVKAHCKCKPFQHIGPLTPPACVFGGYSGVDRVDFVADTSGSMRAGMKAGGKKYTRIAYLKIALKDAIDSLDSDQSFNIIRYSTTCAQWKNGVTKATKAAKASGDSYVDKFTASGATNTHCGLVMAEKDPQVQGIFLLTDGEPTVRMSGWWSGKPKKENRRDPYATIRKVMSMPQWNKNVVVNPISFYAPSRRYKDLEWIASKTKGKHHKIV